MNVIIKQKGGIKMKKTLNTFAKVAKKSAESALKRDANTTTCCAIYQPKAPTALNKFKKHNDK